jgi:hypothetical protein
MLPTRQRADTLESAIRTCVAQDVDELDILVSDNASLDQTRDVVEGFRDPRIRYVNPGHRLGMSEHWEFALSHVADGYVTIIGDDDGVLPDGVKRALEILDTENSDALIWPLTAYYWPRYADPALANHVSVRVPARQNVRSVDSRTTLARIAAFQLPHYWLPSPYWGAVHTGAIARSWAADGQFFKSITPDLYAGTAVAARTSTYLRTNRPLTLSGSSHHSNGASTLASSRRAQPANAREQYLNENQIPFHPDLVFTGSIPVVLAEVLLQARDALEDDIPIPTLELLTRAALRHPELIFNPGSRPEVIDALLRIGELHDERATLEAVIRSENRLKAARFVLAGLENVLAGNPVHACPATVQNIADASWFVDTLLEAGRSAPSAARVNTRGRLVKLRAAGRVATGRLT